MKPESKGREQTDLEKTSPREEIDTLILELRFEQLEAALERADIVLARARGRIATLRSLVELK